MAEEKSGLKSKLGPIPDSAFEQGDDMPQKAGKHYSEEMMTKLRENIVASAKKATKGG